MAFLDSTSRFLSWAWWAIPVGAFVLWKIIEQLRGKEQLHRDVAAFMLQIPLFGRIITDLEIGKYIRTMAILLANHVEIIRSVKISGKIIVNPLIADSFQEVDRRLKRGEKLSDTMNGNPYVPSNLTPMLRVGEESGRVGEMLNKIAENLESDTKIKIKRLLSLFEPAVILFLAVVVLIVVVAILIAMMEINSLSQGGN